MEAGRHGEWKRGRKEDERERARERGEGGGGGEERRKVHMPDSGVSKQLHGRHLLRCINTVKGGVVALAFRRTLLLHQVLLISSLFNAT
jgi:hypothetical protein